MAENKGGSTSLNKELEAMIAALPDKHLLSTTTFKKILKAVVRGLPVGGKGTRVTEGPHGRVIDAFGEAVAAGLLDPWTILPGSAGDKRVMVPGTFGGLMPVIGADRLDETPAPEFTIATGFVNYVYLQCAMVASTDADGFLEGVALEQGDVTVIASTDVLENSPGEPTKWVHLGTIDASGAVTAQNWFDSLDWGAEAWGPETDEFVIHIV